MLASLIPVIALQLPLLIPSHLLPKSSFPICHHTSVWELCPRYCARGIYPSPACFWLLSDTEAPIFFFFFFFVFIPRVLQKSW